MAESKPSTADSLRALIRDTRTYARFLKDIGWEYLSLPEPPRAPSPPVAEPAAPEPVVRPARRPTPVTIKSKPASPSMPPNAITQTADLFPPADPNALAEPIAASQRAQALKKVADQIARCAACPLWKERTQTVPGVGSPQADLLFIGEGPGADEDAQGVPFVGRAGQKLNDMIAYLGLTRDEVAIYNIVKCRPPGNRNPERVEAEACRPYLDQQIDIIQPKVICLLGAVALKHLTGNFRASIMRMRGQWIEYRGVPTLPTFHPAFLLRAYSLANRKAVASDMDTLRDKMLADGLKVAPRPTGQGTQ